MADLPETPTYDFGVYQLEDADLVKGGADGPDNRGIRNLANRTAYLKQHLDSLETVVTQAEAEAGTATTVRAWTALRVRQAINVAVAAVVNSAPSVLDTLSELASALGNDANFATTITNLIGTKSSKTDVQGCVYNIAVAGGTADALTATFTPAITVIADQTVFVRAAYVNATTTPTLAVNALSPITIVKGGNLPLIAGDIGGAGHWLELTLDAILGKAVLLNPASGVRGNGELRSMQVFTASGTYTKPARLVRAKITVVGGGGGGAISFGAGGGGAGTAILLTEAVNIGATVSVTVGGPTQTSSFGALCSATGGASASTVTGGAAGMGSGGTLNFPGEDGGGAGPSNIGGKGGGSMLGLPQGIYTGSGASGGNTVGYGAGGSGRSSTSGQAGSGIVIVEEFF